MFIKTNPNPIGNYVGDCVIRALSIAMNKPWGLTYIDLCIHGYKLCDMPSSNRVWGDYLKEHGFNMGMVSNNCPHCYSVIDFCRENQNGTFILGTGTHVLTVIDGDYYDSWNSGDEHPIYFWKKETS